MKRRRWDSKTKTKIVLEGIRDGPTSLDRLAAKLSYNWLFDVMPLPSIYQGHAPDKFESYYKPHQAFVH